MSAAGVWKEATAADGRTYYYNTVTNATQWEKPVEVAAETPASAWRVHSSPDGRNYYEDTLNNKTQWEMPEVLKNAGPPQNQQPSRGPAAAPQFVAGAPTNFRGGDEYKQPERTMTDRPSGYVAAGTQVKEEQSYATLQEAEAVFFKLLKRLGVQADWSWRQAVKAAVRDKDYKAIQDPRDRKEAFEKYINQVRQEEKEREKDRQAKLREDFLEMLRLHPEITYYTRWSSARPMIEDEIVFRAAKSEDERMSLFNEFRSAEYRKHVDEEVTNRKVALEYLSQLMESLNFSALTRWSEAQGTITSDERFEKNDKMRSLTKLDIIKAFEAHSKAVERINLAKREEERFIKAREERQNRDRFNNLLRELKNAGKIKANTRWMDIHPLIEDDPRYQAMLGQAGSSPIELFWDMMEEEERDLRNKRNTVYDALEAQQFEMTTKTTFDTFRSVMQADPRTASIDSEALRLIFERVLAKVKDREEKERQKNERHFRHEVDALRSRIKRLDPPVTVDDTWEKVRPRLEKLEEFRALDSDDLRCAAFDKHIRRLKDREEDDRREKDREHRNGQSKRRRTRTPEVDAYEADRRKAQADRERTYGKRSIPGLSPPPRPRDWDADRYDPREVRDRRGSHDGRKVSGNHYERDRREREGERERSYLSRADPKDRPIILDYDDVRPSSTTRRRRDSDADSVRSSKVSYKRPRISYDDLSAEGRLSPHNAQRVKRPDRDTHSPRDVRRSKTPAKPEPEQGFHSGSEEGEIEED